MSATPCGAQHTRNPRIPATTAKDSLRSTPAFAAIAAQSSFRQSL